MLNINESNKNHYFVSRTSMNEMIMLRVSFLCVSKYIKELLCDFECLYILMSYLVG